MFWLIIKKIIFSYALLSESLDKFHEINRTSENTDDPNEKLQMSTLSYKTYSGTEMILKLHPNDIDL